MKTQYQLYPNTQANPTQYRPHRLKYALGVIALLIAADILVQQVVATGKAYRQINCNCIFCKRPILNPTLALHGTYDRMQVIRKAAMDVNAFATLVVFKGLLPACSERFVRIENIVYSHRFFAEICITTLKIVFTHAI